MINDVPTSVWGQELENLFLRAGACFARVEPRRRMRDYVRGLLGPVGRKNGWQLAEYAGHATPDGLQHLLSKSRWDADRLRGLAFNERRRHSSWRATPRGQSAAERVLSRTEGAEPLEAEIALRGLKDARAHWAHALSEITQLHQEARGGAVLDEGPQRPGLLLIDCKTARVSDMNRLMDSWVEQTKGRRTATHSIVGKDRSEPDHYVEIVEYPSYEEAIRNLQLPETSRLFHEIVALCDEKPALVGLDVVRDQQYNKAIIHQYFNEVLNGRNLDLIDGLFLPDYQDHDPANKVDAYGPAGVRDKVAGYLSAFDLQFRDLEQTAEGDDVTTRWTCHGTHTGEYMGFPATKKEVEVTGIAIHRIREGKIAEGWWNWDVLGMLQQLGIVEAAV